MSVSWRLWLALLVFGLAGCGGDGSDMRFVENTTLAKPVHRKARDVVRKKLDEELFGTPLNSIAWLKLPVNYGRAEGTIKTVDDHTLTVELNPELSDVSGFDSPEFAHSSMLFTSGANNGKTLSLASFDPSAAAFEAKASDITPAANDGFVVAGHRLRFGRLLYARHCQHCHGISGDGDGPTAKYLYPLPRDYRMGVFKFTSTKTGAKATRDDLRRIVSQGIPGTYMPAFVPLLKDHELTAIIEYIRWLAMRGEVERQLLTEFKTLFAADRAKKDVAEAKAAADQAKKEAKEAADLAKKAAQEAKDHPSAETQKAADEAKKAASEAAEKTTEADKVAAAAKESEIEKQINSQLNDYVQGTGDESLTALLKEVSDDLVEKWTVIEEEGAVVIPTIARVPVSEESLTRGKKLFFGNDAKCADCHGLAGRGNGPQTEAFLENPRTKEKYPRPGLHDDWDKPIKPRDLTRGIYRGGRRPIDIYRRISEGIKGTPMPGGSKSLKPEQIWDLVNYVMSIPFEPAAPRTADARPPTEQVHVK